MRKTGIILITLMLACCLASCSAPPTLTEFKSETGGFAVMTPVPLQEEAKTLETEVGKIDMHQFTGLLNDIVYVIVYSDYPPEAAPPGYAEKMLDGARNGAMGSQGRLVAETSISLAGYPGRELVIDTRGEDDRPPATYKGRLIMVKNRLYQVTVVAPRGKAGDKIIDEFLQSFKLLGQ